MFKMVTILRYLLFETEKHFVFDIRFLSKALEPKLSSSSQCCKFELCRRRQNNKRKKKSLNHDKWMDCKVFLSHNRMGKQEQERERENVINFLFNEIRKIMLCDFFIPTKLNSKRRGEALACYCKTVFV